VVYRVGEQDFFAETPGQPYPSITIVGPDSSFQAWDASDTNTPDRELTDATWRDGTAANVRIWAVGNSGPTMRVYFDVPGPGVLVDPYTLNGTVLEPGEWNELEIPVTNTGDAAAAFTLEVGVPAGWQSKPSVVTWIEAGSTELVSVEVRPYIQEVIGQYELDLVAAAALDPSITSTAPLEVVIDQPPRVFFECDLDACTNIVITVPQIPPITIPVRIPAEPGRAPSFPSP
jgi:hypothetical protein